MFYFIYFIGKFNKKFRLWYYRKTLKYPWGLLKFIDDNPPAISKSFTAKHFDCKK